MPKASSDYDQAVAQVDQHWNLHEQTRGPMRDELRQLVAGLEGVTGLSAGAGADRLVDAVLDYAEFHSTNFGDAAQHRIAALEAQQTRDELAAANETPAPPVPSALETMSPSDTRKWLRDANDNDVREALSAVTADQDAKARQLMTWARADGTTAQVLAAINEHIVKGNPHADMSDGPPKQGVGATSTYEETAAAAAIANPANEPADDALADEIIAWVGDDIDRARVRYDIETEGEQRPDVLAALVGVLDTGADVPSK